MFEKIEELIVKCGRHTNNYDLRRFNVENNQNHWRLTFYDPIVNFDGETADEVITAAEAYLQEVFDEKEKVSTDADPKLEEKKDA